ncbi:NrsF family protein [Mesorhizobium australafricanum]|uniref:NrsF family protein n=1 Tax=Mesorhizobium australafricanum TaxID=3072311 RepID=A0ABU4WTK1_9HYPH|nr:NrsF family protein [Mesorhizobium sp. VK3E]MDX8439380.1 NrsF family protein [Mesorhizobium sp. VK3E]
MRTDDLIKTLAIDAKRDAPSFSMLWWAGVVAAILVAAVVFFATLGMRPDFAQAAQTPRFVFKFVVTIALAASAFFPARALSRPDDAWRKAMPYLALAPILIISAVLAELFLLPPNLWATRMIGTNSMVCLIYIPLIGIGPLGIFLTLLRHGASTRPTLAGAIAGVLAGAIAATLYAAQCTDDSPLFVATWYTIAISGLAAFGAIAANALARW